MKFKSPLLPFFLSMIILLWLGCADPQKKIDEVNTLPKTTIEITDSVFQFGSVKQGDHISHSFHIKNTGTNALVIAHVKTACSCTSSDWSNAPVAPGMQATVTLDLDTGDKEGSINKAALVFMNTAAEKVKISMKGFVEK